MPGHDLATAHAQVAAARDRLERGRRGVRGDLRIDLRDDGQVRLRQVAGSNVAYPQLSGRLEPAPGGTVQLVGAARESRLDLLWVGAFGFVTLITLLGLAASIANGDGAGIAVCAVGSVALGAVTRMCQRARRSFPQDVEQQLALLRRALAGRP